MQSIFNKFIVIICCFATTIAWAQPVDELEQGDELFANGRYMQAFEVYENILGTYDKASPAMLLKMAYIKEGLDEVSEAMYYLNMYYLSTSDRVVLDKMEELAEANNLEGYDAGDLEYFISYYYRYFSEVTLLLAAFVFLLFAVIIRRKQKYNRKPVFSGLVFIIFLGLLFYQVNFGRTYNHGIIQSEQTYIMTGPSAAAKVREIVSSGHRVKILGKQDVWTKINWEGEIAYIKANHLKNITIL